METGSGTGQGQGQGLSQGQVWVGDSPTTAAGFFSSRFLFWAVSGIPGHPAGGDQLLAPRASVLCCRRQVTDARAGGSSLGGCGSGLGPGCPLAALEARMLESRGVWRAAVELSPVWGPGGFQEKRAGRGDPASGLSPGWEGTWPAGLLRRLGEASCRRLCFRTFLKGG